MEEGELEGNQTPGAVGVRHIKKRALRNKSLSITFNDKDLRDYITGFHKRKKKRRKEAEQQLQAKERLKRIEQRKKRKLAREIALHGGSLPAENHVADLGDCGSDIEENGGSIPSTSVSGTKTYENGETTITVTTSELPRKDEDAPSAPNLVPLWSKVGQKNPSSVHTKSIKRDNKQRKHKSAAKTKKSTSLGRKRR